MFAGGAITSTHGGHRCGSSAKFTSAKETNHEQEEEVSEVEDETHPKQSLACALVSSIFCPILGLIALFYAIHAVRAHNQGFYAEAVTFNKQATRWSLITFIVGLTIGSIIAFSFFVRAVLFI